MNNEFSKKSSKGSLEHIIAVNSLTEPNRSRNNHSNQKLPDNFILGTATASAQIETADGIDWGGYKALDGSVFQRTVEHEKHREEDIEFIRRLGNSYRFSFDWSKLQKEPYATLDKAVVAEYRDFVGRIKDKGVNPMLVLHHFSNPKWLQKCCPWPKREAVDVFFDYAKKVVDEFGDLIHEWNTINEPIIYASMSYLFGKFPPFKVDLIRTYATLLHLRDANNLVYNYIKSKKPDDLVGFAKNVILFEGTNGIGSLVASIGRFYYLDYTLKLFSKKADFIGVNYYGRLPFNPWPISEVTWPGKLEKMNKPHDDMWEYYPEGLEKVLVSIYNKYKKPLIVTENGTAGSDEFRIKYIREHLHYLKKAIDEGVPVLGYYHWSTMDNYEWTFGYSKRFGLVKVDPKTFEREMKESGKYYSKVVESKVIL